VSIKIDQAFVSAFSTEFGSAIEIAYENANPPYVPQAQTPFAAIKMQPNPVEARALARFNQTSGIFQVILYYPVDAGDFAAKSMAQDITDFFSIGTHVTYGGQSATILETRRQPGIAEDGWYKLVLSIYYYAITER